MKPETHQAMTYANHTSSYLIGIAAALDLPACAGEFPENCDEDTRALLTECDARGLREEVLK